MKKTSYPNVYFLPGKKKRYFTKSIYPEFKGFDEKTITKKGVTYREVDPSRSKLFAGLAKNLSQAGIKKGTTVLYLGASHGYTASFVSDMIGEEGIIICVDPAPRVMRDLVFVCEQRKNMIPVMADARQPESYEEYVPKEGVDVVFQDISQRDQTNIFLKNINKYLKKGGYGILAYKARSVDVTRKPKQLFEEAEKELKKAGLEVIEKKTLEPYEKDHAIFLTRKKQ